MIDKCPECDSNNIEIEGITPSEWDEEKDEAVYVGEFELKYLHCRDCDYEENHREDA